MACNKALTTKKLSCLTVLLLCNTFVSTTQPQNTDIDLKLQLYNEYKNNCTCEEGCFWLIDDQGLVVPNRIQAGMLPISDVEVEDQVEFILYHRQHGSDAMHETNVVPNCFDCLTHFKNDTKLIVVSHGFISSCAEKSSFGQLYRTGFYDNGIVDNFNIVFVNWEKLASWSFLNSYGAAAANVEPVGKYTAKLLNFLVEQNVTNLNNVHFVGHSLGSHVGNYVANHVDGGKIGRISALDPALPLFGEKNDSDRIDSSDAIFVDVIHTSMEMLPVCVPGFGDGLGFKEPRGHIDFYPNGGKTQPECKCDLQNYLSEFIGACSHSIVNKYFVQSMYPQFKYDGFKHKSWDEFVENEIVPIHRENATMGFETNPTSNGLFYLRTRGCRLSSASTRKVSVAALVYLVAKVLFL